MKWIYTFIISFFGCLLLLANDTRAQQRPNIVLILSDDHAYQAISAYGSRLMQTPNIDRIAHEGVLFNRGYVTNSICGPSRAAIITGKYSHKNGFKDNENSQFDGSQNTFIKELTKSGYQTAWIGKWHLGPNPEGFTYWQILPGQGAYYNPDFITMSGERKRYTGYSANIIENLAEQWLDDRDPSRPFCLVIGHNATHRTWYPDLQDLGRFDAVNFPHPRNFYDDYAGRKAAQVQDMSIEKTLIMGYDLKMVADSAHRNKRRSVRRMNQQQQKTFNAYYDKIYRRLQERAPTGTALTEWKYQRFIKDYLSTAVSLDRNIGRTLDYLDTHGLTDNTIVIYMSDQGFYLGEHGWFDKRFMYEESFRTPLLMRYPGKIKPGTVNNDFVLNIDIGPTLLDAAGVPVPEDMQGTSVLPLLNGASTGRAAIYYHYYENGEHQVSPHFGVKTDRYKLIRFYKRVNSWELFDLQNDPHEMHNIYGKAGTEKLTRKMFRRLLEQIHKYEDKGALKILENPLPDDPFSLKVLSTRVPLRSMEIQKQ